MGLNTSNKHKNVIAAMCRYIRYHLDQKNYDMLANMEEYFEYRAWREIK